MDAEELVRLVRGPSRPTQRELRYRRRRAGALAAVAALALLLGVVVGASGGDEPPPGGVLAATEVGWHGHLAMLAGVGEGSLDLEQRAAETAAIERTLQRTPVVHKGGGVTRQVALTFDDGPSEFTDELLDLLERERVPATWFVLGEHVGEYPETMQRLIDSGQPVANHSWSHPNLKQLDAAGQAEQVGSAAQAIEAAGAPYPRLFRPPYGAYDRTTHDVLARDRELSVLWSVDSLDYSKPGVDAIVQNVVGSVQPGAIILMHDGGGERSQTIAAVERIIPELRRAGYRLVTVPRLLLDDPPEGEDAAPPAGFNTAGSG